MASGCKINSVTGRTLFTCDFIRAEPSNLIALCPLLNVGGCTIEYINITATATAAAATLEGFQIAPTNLPFTLLLHSSSL